MTLGGRTGPCRLSTGRFPGPAALLLIRRVGVVAILIDPPMWPAHGRLWSHLISDSDLEELHAFAQGLGIPRRAFQGDHYDIPAERHTGVVAAGARPVGSRELLRALQSSGLRMQKRLGDKGIERKRSVVLASGDIADIDLIASPHSMDERRVFGAMVFLRDAGGDFAVVHSVRRQEWGSPGGWREPGETVQENAIREVREETGLTVEPRQLVPCGYERFSRVRGTAYNVPTGLDVLQSYTATLTDVRPPLTTALHDTSDRRWVTPAEYADLCRDQFWWPLAVTVCDLA